MILYSRDGCINCEKLKETIDSRGLSYSVSGDFLKISKLGFKEIPVLEYNGVFYGFDEAMYLLSDVNGRGLMSQSKFYEAYSRYDEGDGTYESWGEAIDRVMDMHKRKYENILDGELLSYIKEVSEAYKDKLFLGAQRALQFGGEQLEKHNSRLYNCSASHCDRPDFFGGMTYLLLCGAGVGFSVQKQHIAKLPNIAKREGEPMTHTIEDSIEGWATAVDVLMSTYFVENQVYPEYFGRKVFFDYSKIRPKGAFISGGFKAPGAEPLKKAIDLIELLIERELRLGKGRLGSLALYDIAMFVADAVISGGVRRSATICVFSKDDEDMIKAKTGSWFIDNPQRGRSNNSVALLKSDTTKEEFDEIMESVKHSGEPGFLWFDDLDFMFNPCVEVGMLPLTSDGRSGFQVCNLTEINGAKSTSRDIFLKQCKVASIMGTLQAGYTNFDFLKDATREIVEEEALIGVGITGMMNNPSILFNEEILREGARVVKKWNKIIADKIGINQASRTTVIKPSGNASVLLGCASGIHGEHSNKYFRHIQFNKETEVAKLFMKNNPEMCESSVWNKDSDIVVAFPIDDVSQSIYKKDLLGVKQLEYVKLVQNSWISEGKNKELCKREKLTHNVSNTITVDNWEQVGDFIYNNREYLCGVSLLASAGDSAYPQAPFAEVFSHKDIIDKYGEKSLFTSALIEVGLEAFDGDLWTACSTALGFGEELTESHAHLLKRDFVRRFNKFSMNFKSKDECAKCLKDIYYLHKWWKIKRNIKNINWSLDLGKKQYIDIDTMGAQACHGGNCEI